MVRSTAINREQQLELRRANGARCAEAIKAAGSMSIAELSDATGLSRPTVTARLQDLADAGLVLEVAPESKGAGRPASRFVFVADAGVVAGIELGKHVERLVFTDLVGQALWHGERRPTTDHADERLASAVAWVVDAAADLGRPLQRVGVAVPGAMDPDGRLVESAAFAEWRGRSVPPIVDAAFPVAVDVLHDVASAMLAEQRMGAAVDIDTFVVPVLWHRVSAGIVVSGRVHGGHTGRAGALGAVASGRLSPSDVDDVEWPSDPHVTGLVEAAAQGDSYAASSIDRFCALAAEQIAMLQLVIDPELIVLHGPLAVHDSLVADVTARLDESLDVVAPVVVSEFGQLGTVIGAVLTALDGAADDLIGPGMAPHVLDRTRLSHAIGGRADAVV